MFYVRESITQIAMGVLWAVIGGLPFLWMMGLTPFDLPSPGTVPIETFKLVGQVSGAVAGVGVAIALAGLARRIFRPNSDKANRRLVNFALRFGIVLLMFAALPVFAVFVFETATPEMMPTVNAALRPYWPVIYAGGGLGALLFVVGLFLPKPQL